METSTPIQSLEQPVNRLVVLIPDFHQVDEYGLGKEVRFLARSKNSAVLYLTVVQTYDDEMPAIHRLTRLTAVTRDFKVRADLSVVLEKSWLTVLRRLYQPGDLMVCFAEHQVRKGLFQHTSIYSELSEKMHLPAWVINNGHDGARQTGGINGRNHK
jgi:hypothetical protein